MSADQVRDGGRTGGYGPFVTGLVLIVAASVLNLYLDGKSRADLEILPTFLLNAYEQSGKLGVTMVLGSLGVLVMLWGWFLQTAAETKDAAARARATVSARESGSLGSSVTLDTQKYVERSPYGENWYTTPANRGA